MIHALFFLGACALAAPSLVLALECLLARLPDPMATRGPRPRLAVLVPAHDEAPIIGATVDALRAQLRAGDRLLVVADNCGDDTADVARRRGAEVVARVDPARRGKGYALAFGARSLAADPPEVVVIVDADCRLREGALDALAREVAATGRPAQGVYLLEAPAGSPLASLSALAFLVRNLVRPLGLARLHLGRRAAGRGGGPCQLTGSGMAFPYPLLSTTDALGSSLVEDLLLGVELTLRGYPPILCPQARIDGELPIRGEAALGQRRRWEHGHLGALLRHGPRLVLRGLLDGDAASLFLGLDLLVPPLSLLLLLQLAGIAAALIAAWALGDPIPLALLAAATALALAATLVAWARFGRALVPGSHLLAAPLYVAWKLPLYVSFLLRRAETRWIRTEREGARSRDADLHEEGARSRDADPEGR
jgi:cellulose synthase/poly-beta-1,6-N-acetylglucosamine synthase-like glycosyltransferase